MYKVQNNIPRNVNSDYHLTMLMGSEFIFLTLLILFFFKYVFLYKTKKISCFGGLHIKQKL